MTFARGLRQIVYMLILVLTLKSCVFAAADRPVSIAASPKLQLALYGKTTQVYLKLTIPKDPQNRAVCVAVDGGVYRSSCWEIMGEAGAYRTEWWVRGITPGAYTVTVELTQAGGVVKRDTTTFCVAGGEGECGLGGEP